HHFKDFIKQRLNTFFKTKNKEYDKFLVKLKSDNYYPYQDQVNATSKSKVVLFDNLAYLVEEKYNLITSNNRLREIIYPLIDRTIANRDLDNILLNILRLENKYIKKFNKLLDHAEIEDIIEFSEKVSRKNEDLEFLEKITLTPISKYVAERRELHKVVEKLLWIFGEKYLENTKLLSDKGLENNLRELREKTLKYKADKAEDNINKEISRQLRSITDLFLYSEKPINEVQREVLIVELKAPKVKISPKELDQVIRYSEEIQSSRFFTEDIEFNIILIGTEINEKANYRLESVTKPRENPYFFFQNPKKNISISVMRWGQLIEANKRRLNFLGNKLKVKDIGVEKKIRDDFEEIGFERVKSVLRKVRIEK
ncbi:MAG TPA: hypothetical protein VK766_08705, partial [Cytophagaceae bacterium]|nr:hypothetical protein [Cytophagaceae bacterium]